MSGHSKGPWRLGGANVVHSDAEGVIVCFVGTAEESVRRFSGPRQEADARLIAAAPALLAALEALLWQAEDGRQPNGRLDADVAAARAAIALARGGR